MTIGDSVVDLDIRALVTRNIEAAALLLDDACPDSSSGVVFMVEGISSVGLVEVGGHIDPALVVVYAEGNHEVFGVGFEVEDTRRAAVIHDEDFLAVEFSPDGIFPGSPLEDLKLGASVGLVDAGDDGVRHSESVGEVRSQIVRWGDSHGSDTHLGYLEVGLDAFLVASRLRSSPLTYRAP